MTCFSNMLMERFQLSRNANHFFTQPIEGAFLLRLHFFRKCGCLFNDHICYVLLHGFLYRLLAKLRIKLPTFIILVPSHITMSAKILSLVL